MWLLRCCVVGLAAVQRAVVLQNSGTSPLILPVSGSVPHSRVTCSSHPCGPSSFGTCHDVDNSYMCDCKPGYRLVIDKHAHQRCEQENCDSDACGPPEAVRQCRMVGTAGHLCVCNADFDATINANGDVKCEASLESARQLPSGPRIETGYLSDEDVYRHEYPSGRDEERKHRGRLDGESSRRTEGSTGNTDEGRRTNQGSGKDSGHAGSGGSGRSEQSDGDAGSDGAKSGERKEEKEEGKGGPAAAIAGGVIGGLLLLGAAGGGVAYAMKRKKADERDQVEYESGGGAREDSEDVEVLVDVDDKTWE